MMKKLRSLLRHRAKETPAPGRVPISPDPSAPQNGEAVPKQPGSVGTAESRLQDILLQIRERRIGVEPLARLMAEAGPPCVHNRRYYSEFFKLWQETGIHVTPVHFYQPVPDTRNLPDKLWQVPSQLPGIDINGPAQLEFLRHRFPQFREECNQFSSDNADAFNLTNGHFDGLDALVAYCMVRYFKPRTIIEVGSGYSSLILARAAVRNGNAPLICIEPFPLEFLEKDFPGLQILIRRRVEEIDYDFFSQLEAGDILFLDSSHTVKMGGDVTYLFLEILPRLKPGVVVHVHDIFFPFDYPRDWVMNECRFWSEQYLLQSFLAFNNAFEILLCNNYLSTYYMAELQAAFPQLPSCGGGSFWMQRRVELL
jgi:Methyltransferase domain